MLAEASRQLGGRVTRESRLTGLSEWARIRDWRVGQIDKLDNVDVFPESKITADDVLSLDIDHVLIATGAKWATDAVGRHSDTGFGTANPNMILSAETILDDVTISADKIVIYDDDHYYLGSVIALELRKSGHDVVLVTPAGSACSWGEYTDEQASSNAALIDAGVEIITNQTIEDVENGFARMSCVFSGKISELECDAVIPLTRKIPETDLYYNLTSDKAKLSNAGIKSVVRIGDAEAPSIIAAAVHSGYRAAMDLGKDIDLAERYGKREHPTFS